MCKRFCAFVFVLFLACSAGCNRGVAPPPEEAVEKPPEATAPTLAELLTKPRAELAAEADDLFKQFQAQEQARREGKLRYTLLPEFRFPLIVPVFREAKYSEAIGFSLPPYILETDKDTTTALHLARFGDREAALKLADPSDATATQRVDALKLEKNYPLEWTRLVALKIHAAQVHLATGEPAAITELAKLHADLKQALDPKAAQGPLGAALLGRGRWTLAKAKAAFQKEKKQEQEEQVDKALADWGDVPAILPSVLPGASRAEANRALRSLGTGRVLSATSNLRALDLLCLPFPGENIAALIAVVDPADKLTDLMLTYKPRAGDVDLAPEQVGYLLEDLPQEGSAGPRTLGFRTKTYPLGNVQCEVAVLSRGAGVGGFVRIRDPKLQTPAPTLPREFGIVNLDRSYEYNRVRFSPEMRRPTLTTKQRTILDRISNPVPALKPALAMLQQQKGHDTLISDMTLRSVYPDTGAADLDQVAKSLWSSFGIGRIEGVQGASEETGGHLALVWEDAKTRYTLRLPYDNSASPEFQAADIQGDKAAVEREKAVVAADRVDRKARLESNRPFLRLPRFVEQIELSKMTKDQVVAAIPNVPGVTQRWLPTGLLVVYKTDLPATATNSVRQLFVRFAPNGRVTEVRGRYFDGPGAKTLGQGVQEFIAEVRKRLGAPEELPSTWTRLWEGMPPAKPAPTLYRWRDDSTVATCQFDAFGLEFSVKDCPLEYELGIPQSSLRFLSGGPEKRLQLGMPRAEVLQSWNIKQPQMAGDALVITTRDELYDSYFVWFNKQDRVDRIAVQHRARPDPSKLGEELTKAWGSELARQELESFGHPRRLVQSDKRVLESLSWHDDVTRLRLFWQETATDPPRMFTEWKDIAVP